MIACLFTIARRIRFPDDYYCQFNHVLILTKDTHTQYKKYSHIYSLIYTRILMCTYAPSGQFPELHARICKTYLDALGEDKSLATVYGAIAGLSAMGNSIVRTVLLPQLGAIQSRLQTAELDYTTTSSSSAGGGGGAEGGSGGGVAQSASAVPAAGGASSESEGGKTAASTSSKGSASASASNSKASKRKRGASMDGSAVATTSAALPSTATGDSCGSNSIIREKEREKVVKFSRAGAAKVMQQQVAVGMCREALLRAIGKSIFAVMLLLRFFICLFLLHFFIICKCCTFLRYCNLLHLTFCSFLPFHFIVFFFQASTLHTVCDCQIWARV